MKEKLETLVISIAVGAVILSIVIIACANFDRIMMGV